jgi:hypothetical protein
MGHSWAISLVHPGAPHRNMITRQFWSATSKLLLERYQHMWNFLVAIFGDPRGSFVLPFGQISPCLRFWHLDLTLITDPHPNASFGCSSVVGFRIHPGSGFLYVSHRPTKSPESCPPLETLWLWTMLMRGSIPHSPASEVQILSVCVSNCSSFTPST